jgi:hypothetical protein
VFDKTGNVEGKLDGLKVVVGTTDIHDYGKEIIKPSPNRRAPPCLIWEHM